VSGLSLLCRTSESCPRAAPGRGLAQPGAGRRPAGAGVAGRARHQPVAGRLAAVAGGDALVEPVGAAWLPLAAVAAATGRVGAAAEATRPAGSPAASVPGFVEGAFGFFPAQRDQLGRAPELVELRGIARDPDFN